MLQARLEEDMRQSTGGDWGVPVGKGKGKS